MSLRSRLTFALVVVSTIGLVVFGATTTSLYRHSLVEQLDQQLMSAARPQGDRLIRMAASGLTDGSCSTAQPDFVPSNPNHGGTSGAPLQGLDVDARLFVGGTQVVCVPALTSLGKPSISKRLAQSSRAEFTTISSVNGKGSWRVYVEPVDDVTTTNGADAVVIVAKRTTAMDDSMSRLIRIELAAGAGLLIVLAAGAWLVLRRGLRPLEQMADSAAGITAGTLSDRVVPADDRTEVGQLGLAINSMLEGIEGAFAERDATERRLRQFLADASHELRTPITSIQGFAELFRIGDERLTPDLPVIMSRIESESARMHTLVEDLMLLARLDRTREVRTEQIDLNVLAADACTDATAHEPGRPITLDAPMPVVVRGDADHLRQAITNLVTNALRHTPAGTPIEVRTRLLTGWAQVTVRDHGPGLDPVGLEHAFDRFWQADTARVGTGSGLGLSIVAGIAEEHGGTVTVENVADGGASFTISIPVVLADQSFDTSNR